MNYFFTKGAFMVLFSYVNNLHQYRWSRDEKQQQSFKNNEHGLGDGARGRGKVWGEAQNIFCLLSCSGLERGEADAPHCEKRWQDPEHVASRSWQSVHPAGHSPAKVSGKKGANLPARFGPVKKGGKSRLPP